MFCSCKISTNSASRGPSAIAEPLVLVFFFFIFFNDFSETNYLKICWTHFRNLYIKWKRFGCRWSIWTLFLPRDALLSAVYAVVVCLSVCLCVCVSDTLRYCIKTAKRRITQITPHDSALTLVFWHQSSLRNSKGITPYGGDKCRWVKIRHFRRKSRYNSKTVQDRHIVSIKVE